MKYHQFLIFLMLLSFNTNSNLYISMILESVDDCITKIYYENNTIIYKNKNSETKCDSNVHIEDNPIIDYLPYSLGQKIKVELKDFVGNCGMSITVYLNEYIIKTEAKKFWKCENCERYDHNYFYNERIKRLECINYFRTADNSYAKFFYFSFQMDSLTEIINGGNGISKFPYYLTEEKYFFIYVPNFDEDINIIYLNSEDIFYSKNDYDKIIQPIYEYLNFKLYFDKYFINPGKFFSLDKSENDIELDDKTLYNIDQIKGLRYNITESEKKRALI